VQTRAVGSVQLEVPPVACHMLHCLFSPPNKTHKKRKRKKENLLTLKNRMENYIQDEDYEL